MKKCDPQNRKDRDTIPGSDRRNLPRVDGPEKLTGRALYVADLPFNKGQDVHGVTIRSTMANAKIKKIECRKGFDWSGFTLVTARDIPGANHVPLIFNDQPVLADGFVRHIAEPIAILGHPDPKRLAVGARAIDIAYESVGKPSLTMEEAIAVQSRVFGDENIFKKYLISKGDVEAAFKQAHRIIKGCYSTASQEQAYLENNGMVAHFENGRLVVIGSMQCPFYIQKALRTVMGMEPSMVEVYPAVVGGGFGGKEEFPSLLAAHAALLAKKSGAKARILYERHEDLFSTPKRHPSKIWIETAHDRTGRITAMRQEVWMDGGAYSTMSPVVLSRGVIHAGGPYSIPNVEITGKAIATNNLPNGAFRGFGAPQTIFATENHFDGCAVEFGIDPAEFRRWHIIHKGESTATGHAIGKDCHAGLVLDRALKNSRYRAKKKMFLEFNIKNKWVKRGIGLALFFHGAGFTGNGEVFLNSRVEVGFDSKSGKILAYSGNTEIGQGKDTIFTQIVADALGIPIHRAGVNRPNTLEVPDSGPTVASRTAMVVGFLVHRAAIDFRSKLEGAIGKKIGSGKALLAACEKFQCPPRGEAVYAPPPNVVWNDATYSGEPYGAYAWGCYVAEVEIPLDTFEAKVIDFHAVQEVGKVLNPILAAGQIEGGVVQGIGWAMMEEVKFSHGAVANPSLTNYVIPTFMDVPSIKVAFLEKPYSFGPSGAKGIGELPMDGPGPAIANAVAMALGRRLNRLPMTPEAMWTSFTSGRKGQ